MQQKRAQTDKSLRTERSKVDKLLTDVKVAECVADAVVDVARLEADALLLAARDKADQGTAAAAAIEHAGVLDDRLQADEVLRAARAIADERLRQERDDCRRALAVLLPWERARTDRDLLTERARSDDAIAERDDFMAIVSHDLRYLLGAIALSSSQLSNGASASEEGARIVESGQRVKRYVARMNRLIGDLVDVASIDAGKLACAIVSSDPLAVVAETLEAFRPAAEEKGILLESRAAGALPHASFDYERMLQVLANLVSNALKFTPPGGRIGIHAECVGEDVQFAVSDTGMGIPDGMFDSVFQRFWQVSTNDRRGTGLGLYISKSVVEAHRGRIWVESELGKGSVFRFTVPALPVALANPA